MKKFYLAVLILTTCLGFLSAQNIRVTQPRTGTVFTTSITRNITVAWTSSGISGDVRIVLRKADGSQGFPLSDSHPFNRSPATLLIPAEATPGDYFVRVKQGSVKGESGQFKIQTAITFIPGAVAAHDLEVTNIYLDTSRFLLSARVKSNINRFSGDVKFRIFSNGMTRNTRDFTRGLDIPAGRSQIVNFFNVGSGMFNNKCGVFFTVTADPEDTLNENNRGNNVKRKQLFKHSTQNGMVRRFRFLKRVKEARNNQEIVIEPLDCEHSDTENVTARIEVTLGNCGAGAMTNGILHIRHYTEFTCVDGPPRPIEFSELIHSQRGINLEAGQTILIQPTVTLRRAHQTCRMMRNEMRVYFETSDPESLQSDNRLTFRIRFNGF